LVSPRGEKISKPCPEPQNRILAPSTNRGQDLVSLLGKKHGLGQSFFTLNLNIFLYIMQTTQVCYGMPPKGTT